MSGLLSLDIGQIDFNRPKFKMVGGLTLRDVKIKYNWLLNAQVQDAIIGEDENGLVWYSGQWVCGEWVDGTWYSGIFVEGRWKSGNFYSYDIDEKEALNGRLHINRVDIRKSRFIGGSFEGGHFHYGIFGNIANELSLDIPVTITDEWVIDNVIDFEISGETFIYQPEDGIGFEEVPTSTFSGGIFHNGLFNSAYFENGDWYDGIANNIIWYNGNWYNGSFLVGNWYDGNFYSGYFSNGNWYDGKLFTNDSNNPTKFGLNYKKDYNYANWYNGEFINGEWYSGVVEYGDMTPTFDNTISTWYNGTFTNGIWYGGVWKLGTWQSGSYRYGMIENIYWINGHINDCICNVGTFLTGDISGGVFNNATFENVNLGIEI